MVGQVLTDGLLEVSDEFEVPPLDRAERRSDFLMEKFEFAVKDLKLMDRRGIGLDHLDGGRLVRF